MEKKKIIKEYYKAMEQNRIKPFFQPQYTANGFKVAAAEALCRIEIPDGTYILPEEFIGGLEYTGEICDLDWHMVKMVCSLLSEMRYRTGKQIPIAVNLSRRHTEEWDAAEHLCSIVDSCGLNHDLIEVEITETYDEHDILLNDMIAKIRSKGFSVALDDFGSGNSTLGFVQETAFDTLKIDKSFLKGDCEDHKVKAVIESLIAMADNLGMKTVVEGVENARQLSYLNCYGCTLLQGNYLSEPLPEKRFLELLIGQDSLQNMGV